MYKALHRLEFTRLELYPPETDTTLTNPIASQVIMNMSNNPCPISSFGICEAKDTYIFTLTTIMVNPTSLTLIIRPSQTYSMETASSGLFNCVGSDEPHY